MTMLYEENVQTAYTGSNQYLHDACHVALRDHLALWRNVILSTQVNKRKLRQIVRLIYGFYGYRAPEDILFCAHPLIPTICEYVYSSQPIYIDFGNSYVCDQSGEMMAKRLNVFNDDFTLTGFGERFKLDTSVILTFRSLDEAALRLRFDRTMVSRLLHSEDRRIVLHSLRDLLLDHPNCGRDTQLFAQNLEWRLWDITGTGEMRDFLREASLPLFHNLSRLIDISCQKLISDVFSHNHASNLSSRCDELLGVFLSNGGWILGARKEVAYVVLRPKQFHVDENNGLHSDSGPAVILRDGIRYYFDHNVSVPPKVILKPAKLTVQDILHEPNTEVRRVMLSRKGISAFLSEAEPEVVDSDCDRSTLPRRLLKIGMNGDEPLVVLHVIDPAKKHLRQPADVFLRVPPAMETCAQAAAWTFGYENSAEYSPSMEQ